MTIGHVRQAVVGQGPFDPAIGEFFGRHSQGELLAHLGAEELAMDILHDDVTESRPLLGT